jgi:hypothetical protein
VTKPEQVGVREGVFLEAMYHLAQHCRRKLRPTNIRDCPRQGVRDTTQNCLRGPPERHRGCDHPGLSDADLDPLALRTKRQHLVLGIAL